MSRRITRSQTIYLENPQKKIKLLTESSKTLTSTKINTNNAEKPKIVTTSLAGQAIANRDPSKCLSTKDLLDTSTITMMTPDDVPKVRVMQLNTIIIPTLKETLVPIKSTDLTEPMQPIAPTIVDRTRQDSLKHAEAGFNNKTLVLRRKGIFSAIPQMSSVPICHEAGLNYKRISSRRKTISSETPNISSSPVHKTEVQLRKISTPMKPNVQLNQNSASRKQSVVNSIQVESTRPVRKEVPVNYKQISSRRKTISSEPPNVSSVPLRKCEIQLRKTLTPIKHNVQPKPNSASRKQTVVNLIQVESTCPVREEVAVNYKLISSRRKTISSELPNISSVSLRKCEIQLKKTFTPIKSNVQPKQNSASRKQTVVNLIQVESTCPLREEVAVNYKLISSRRKTISSELPNISSVPLRKCEIQLKKTLTPIKPNVQPKQNSASRKQTSVVNSIQVESTLPVSQEVALNYRPITSRRKTISLGTPNLQSVSLHKTEVQLRKISTPIKPNLQLKQNSASRQQTSVVNSIQVESTLPVRQEVALNYRPITSRRKTIYSDMPSISGIPERQSEIWLTKPSVTSRAHSKQNSAERKQWVVNSIPVESNVPSNNDNLPSTSAKNTSNRQSATDIASNTHVTDNERENEIIIPHDLYELLINDAHVISRKKKRYKIPGSRNIAKIIDDYVALKQPEATDENHEGLSFNQIFQNIIDYVDELLSGQLLYESERLHNLDLLQRFPSVKVSTLYPPIYLLRLFVQLNYVIQNRDKESKQRLVGCLNKFIEYLVVNKSDIFDLKTFC